MPYKDRNDPRNKEKQRQATKRMHEKDPEKWRKYHRDWMWKHTLKKLYGITVEEYERLHTEQGGVCKICGEPEKSKRAGRTRRLCVDHCHTTKIVRGLLCNACNHGIGKFRDIPQRLRDAADYLEASGVVQKEKRHGKHERTGAER